MGQYSRFLEVAFFHSSYIECQRGVVHLKSIKFQPLVASFFFLKQCIDEEFNPKLFKRMNLKSCLNVMFFILIKNSFKILNVASFLLLDIVLKNISDVIFMKVTPSNLIPLYNLMGKSFKNLYFLN